MKPRDIDLGAPGSNPFPSVCGTHEVEMLIAEYVRICQKRNDWRPVVLTEFDSSNVSCMNEAIFGQWFEWIRERETVVLGARAGKMLVTRQSEVCKKCHWTRAGHSGGFVIDIAPAPCGAFR